MCDTPATTDTRIGAGASTGTGTGTGKRLVCETPDLECWLISAPRQAYLASAGWLIGH